MSIFTRFTDIFFGIDRLLLATKLSRLQPTQEVYELLRENCKSYKPHDPYLILAFMYSMGKTHLCECEECVRNNSSLDDRKLHGLNFICGTGLFKHIEMIIQLSDREKEVLKPYKSPPYTKTEQVEVTARACILDSILERARLQVNEPSWAINCLCSRVEEHYIYALRSMATMGPSLPLKAVGFYPGQNSSTHTIAEWFAMDATRYGYMPTLSRITHNQPFAFAAGVLSTRQQFKKLRLRDGS